MAELRTLQLGIGWQPEDPGGGLDRMFHGLVLHLPGAGVAVDGLVTGSRDVFRNSRHAVRAVAPRRSPMLRRLAAMRAAVHEAFARRPPDLVASHFAFYALPALDALRRRPLVVHFHGPWADESRVEGAGRFAVAAKAAVERAVYRRGTLNIVLSEAFGRVLQSSYGVNESRIRVVPGGVDAAVFDVPCTPSEARERLGWPQDRPILLAVRRLTQRMGLGRLIQAFAAVRHALPEALLYIAGSGPLASELQARIDDAGLAGHVRLLGFVPDDDLPLAYRAATLCVVPTVALEGFGLVTVEALAAGTPALVTPVGGLPEVVRPLAPDLVMADARAETMAGHMVAALRGELDLPDSRACRAYARSHFDWGVVAERTGRVYREALNGRRGP